MSDATLIAQDPDRNIFKPIPGFEGYRINCYGEVESCHNSRGRLVEQWHTLKPSLGGGVKRDRLFVVLRKSGRSFNRYIHTLVLITFGGDRPEGTEACHCDGNALNNHISNLRWDSHTENIRDKHKHGTMPIGFGSHGMAKLTDDQVRDIRATRTDVSNVAIARQYLVSPSLVSLIRRGKTRPYVK